MKKKMRWLYILLCIILPAMSFGAAAGDEIVAGAQVYAGYNEVVSNITQVSYCNETFWWIDYSKYMGYSGSLLLDDQTTPVTDRKLLKTITTAWLIHRDYDERSVWGWLGFSESYNLLSSELSGLGGHLTAAGFKDTYLIKDLASDSKDVGVSAYNMALYLNKSIRSISPTECGSYRSYENQTINKLMEVNTLCGRIINCLEEYRWENNSAIKTRNHVINSLRRYSNAVNGNLNVMQSNREAVDNYVDDTVDDIYTRATAKRREPQYTGLIFIIILITSVILLSIYIHHTWR